MKFIVSKTTLLQKLNIVAGVITNQPVIPILENFLFELEDNVLLITASDLETTITIKITVEQKKPGIIAIPAKILLATLKELPEQPIEIEAIDDPKTIMMYSHNGSYKIASEDAADFPKKPEPEELFEFEMEAPVLSRLIDKTIFSVSKDELRPAMTGMYVEQGDNRISFVSTDGHRLVKCERTDVVNTAQDPVIIPLKPMSILRKIIGSAEINIEMSKTNAFFYFEDITIICRLIDKRYPDYRNVVPHENPIEITVDRNELIQATKRMSLYANKTNRQMRMEINNHKIKLSAKDVDWSNEATETIACDYTGTEMMIGFNPGFLLDALINHDNNEVKLTMSESNRACLLLPTENHEGENLTMLVMPVMLESNI